MSEKLPAITSTQVIRKLRRAGFSFDRQAKGSHEIWYNAETRKRVVIPHHAGATIPKGTLRAIIRQSGLTVDELVAL